MRHAVKFRDGSNYIFDDANQVIIDEKGKSMRVEMDIMTAFRKGYFDAEGAIFFQRELEFVKAKSYDVKYADKKIRELFSVSNEAGPGVTTINYKTYDRSGAAKVINAYADDLPRADVAGTETTINVRSVGISFAYNIDEIQSSQLVGRQLDQRRANAAFEAVEQTVNDVGFFGDSVSGMPGLFSNPNIPTGDVTDPGSGTEWVNKTPEEILDDINSVFADIVVVTKMKERADRLLLPVAQWNYIVATPRSINSDTTILQYVVNNSPYISSAENIIPINECAAVNNPLLAKDAMVAYDSSPDAAQLEIPVELEWLPLEQRNLEFITNGRARLAGLNIYYPLAFNIATGI